MVRLVSAKPPKIDGVEGGSATPSSTPTPKVNTWEQVEERQQRQRGSGQPVRPTTVTPPAPKPATTLPPGTSSEPLGPPVPKNNSTLAEIPGMNKFGKMVTGATYIPGEGGFPAPWKGQFEPVGGRPLASGRPPVLTGPQKVGNILLGTANQFGSPNPLRGWRSGGKAGVIANVAGMMSISGATAAMQQDTMTEVFQEQGYPKDVAAKMATAYIGTYATAGAATAAGAEAVSDATFMAASAAGGALIGSLFFGVGAVPGAAAGAAAGWAASRVVAGASAVINLVEGFLSMGNAAANTNNPGNIKMVNLPSLDDFWIHGGINEDGTPRNGLLGLNARGFAAQGAHEAAMSAANAVVTGLVDQGRFYTDDETLKERRYIEEGTYATSSEVDPKYEFYKKFIQEGYFVYQEPNGDYKVDTLAVQQFLWDNARYKTEADLRTALPEKRPAGQAFYTSVRLTDDMLGGMWSTNSDIPMP